MYIHLIKEESRCVQYERETEYVDKNRYCNKHTNNESNVFMNRSTLSHVPLNNPILKKITDTTIHRPYRTA